MARSPNQFAQTVTKGMLDLKTANLVLSCQVDGAQVASLVAGQVVSLAATAGGVPKVIATASDALPLFGVVVYNTRQASFAALEKLEIACGSTIIYMEASAAIARGVRVMNVAVGAKVATATIGKNVIGIALDTATADGDLIRVLIADQAVVPLMP